MGFDVLCWLFWILFACRVCCCLLGSLLGFRFGIVSGCLSLSFVGWVCILIYLKVRFGVFIGYDAV